MICISVTPSSRTLAPADLLNASRKADLIELCLDNFLKTPDVGDLLKVVDKPILVSCRRKKDGGHFEGTEEERMTLLRNTIVAGPAFVELDLEIAASVPRFGNTKRVISFTSLNRPPENIDEIFEKCYQAKADIVKFTWPTDDLDQAWPLLATVTKSRELPVVGQGIGQSGLTFSLLGCKYNSPWIYAALEKGMEAYDHQPSVWTLEEEYHWKEIGRKTRFIGVVGMGATENTTVRILNAAFAKMQKPIRCLPLQPGKTDRLQKMLTTMKINALLIDPLYDGRLVDMCKMDDAICEESGLIDLATETSNGWKGRSSIVDMVLDATAKIRESERWMQGRAITVFGSNSLAYAFALKMHECNAAVSVAGPSDNTSMSMAKKTGSRHLTWSSIYTASTDTIVLASREIVKGTDRGQLNPSIIREGMTVIDLSAYPNESQFAVEARARGAIYVSAADVFRKHLRHQFKQLTNLELPDAAFDL